MECIQHLKQKMTKRPKIKHLTSAHRRVCHVLKVFQTTLRMYALLSVFRSCIFQRLIHASRLFLQTTPDDAECEQGKYDLMDALMDVLTHDKHEFVHLFLECGVSIKNFIKHRLCELYNEVYIKVHSQAIIYFTT